MPLLPCGITLGRTLVTPSLTTLYCASVLYVLVLRGHMPCHQTGQSMGQRGRQSQSGDEIWAILRTVPLRIVHTETDRDTRRRGGAPQISDHKATRKPLTVTPVSLQRTDRNPTLSGSRITSSSSPADLVKNITSITPPQPASGQGFPTRNAKHEPAAASRRGRPILLSSAQSPVRRPLELFLRIPPRARPRISPERG
jgi:hypothetical protein